MFVDEILHGIQHCFNRDRVNVQVNYEPGDKNDHEQEHVQRTKSEIAPAQGSYPLVEPALTAVPTVASSN